MKNGDFVAFLSKLVLLYDDLIINGYFYKSLEGFSISKKKDIYIPFLTNIKDLI